MANPRERELADRLHSAAIHLLRRVRRSDPMTGVAAAQLSALSVLLHGPLTVSQMAIMEQVKPPTMSRLVTEMERGELVRRHADPTDARLAHIEMTPKGRRALTRGRDLRIADIERRIAALSPAQRAALAKGLETLEGMLRDD